MTSNSSFIQGIVTEQAFFEAVWSAHRKLFGSRGGPYNIDSMAYFATAVECYLYTQERMRDRPRFGDREELLAFAVENVKIPGLVLEFGVHSGHTINLISQKFVNSMVYGFDSFEGLPEQWGPNTLAGHFAVDKVPQVRENVELVVGWFDSTLPFFLEGHTEDVSFLHIDCDLYSSTITVLTNLAPRIVPGTIIVFDEYFNYPDGKRHEFLAFKEFTERYGVRYEYKAVQC